MPYEIDALPLVIHFSHDGGTTDNYIGDYSGEAAVEAVCQPPAGERWVISRMIIYIEDTGNPTLSTYGNIAELDPGIRFGLRDDDGVLAYLDGGEAITDNGHWARLMYDWTHQTWSAVNYYMVGRYTFSKFVPGGIPLHGDDPLNQRLFLSFSEDFTGLIKHEYYAEGYKWSGKQGTRR